MKLFLKLRTFLGAKHSVGVAPRNQMKKRKFMQV
ncbi:hypothetical protein MEC_00020 [Bartonella alsatica IBS 382]|uniref:Uncharacterized protein n=1 Tax=Bartonella alsatica IBS 382 TaxID=1094551 RepID=J1IX21_9HYPH|nr:hypothetical protein MEC_00020 [Bartonella alsatica IBS 382]